MSAFREQFLPLLAPVLHSRWLPLAASVVLAALTATSAIRVVVQAHDNRTLYFEAGRLEQERAALLVEKRRMLLEQAAWSSHARIEQLATESLGMKQPGQVRVLVVE